MHSFDLRGNVVLAKKPYDIPMQAPINHRVVVVFTDALNLCGWYFAKWALFMATYRLSWLAQLAGDMHEKKINDESLLITSWTKTVVKDVVESKQARREAVLLQQIIKIQIESIQRIYELFFSQYHFASWFDIILPWRDQYFETVYILV